MNISLAILMRVFGGSTGNGFSFGEVFRLAAFFGIVAVLFGSYAAWLNRRQETREWVVVDISPTSDHPITRLALVANHSWTTASDLAAEMAVAGFPEPT